MKQTLGLEVIMYTQSKALSLFLLVLALLSLIFLVGFTDGSTDSEDICTVRFYEGGVLLYEESLPRGDVLTKPDEPIREGYIFGGWYTDSALTAPFSFAEPIVDNLNLFAHFTLIPPSFEISPLSFTYDAREHYLALDNVSHPLMSEGSFSYEWFKGSQYLGIGDSRVLIREVKDAGEYKCKITFSYKGDFATITTPPVSVNVEKMQIYVNDIPPVEYNGMVRSPDIAQSPYYTFSAVSFSDVGEYGVTLYLCDSENCAFVGESAAYKTLIFKIERAKNFISEISASDAFVGTPPTVVATARFGEVIIEYLVGGEWTQEYPDKVGEYMLRAAVRANANYEAAISEPMPIKILPDRCVGIGFISQPIKSEYLAFDKIELDGARLYSAYASGRREELDLSDITVSYKTGASLSVFDRAVTLVYEGHSLPLSVTVRPREYDTSQIKVVNSTLVYSGANLLPTVSGAVIGLDGIPLKYSVIGGATDVGSYTATLVFETESFNYITPSPITVRYEIVPLALEAVWGELEFIYDKAPKIPTAHITTPEGGRIELAVKGAMTDAGEYIAKASSPSPNYSVKNSTSPFVIHKAYLDLSCVSWSADSFLYNGREHSVSLLGLPDGVSVIGYAGRSATEAGEYRAVATLLYDERNYISDGFVSHTYTVLPIAYKLNDIIFGDSIHTYDGTPKHPEIIGALPVGCDGSSPTYTLSGLPTDACEGAAVSVTFFSSSKNYLPPEPIILFVTVLPKPIEVLWQNVSFVYDGGVKLPMASADECEISITGGGTDAGDYIATAVPKSKNFKIINPTVSFTVSKRNNSFTKIPSVVGGFVGDAMLTVGEAEHGCVVFKYYKDEALTVEASLPLSQGSYFAIACVSEDKNYLPLTSLPIPFSVSAVVPTGITVRISKDTLYAYERLGDGSIEVYYVNNNGTQIPVAIEDVRIEYQSASSLRAPDTFVRVRVGEFTEKIEITVLRADADMSSVSWGKTEFPYDGSERVLTLTGLPEGISVKEYILNRATEAGIYRLSCTFDYDAQSYNPPVLPECYLVIHQAIIALPEDVTFIYDGEMKGMSVRDTEYYKGASVSAAGGGRYFIPITLYDTKNYKTDRAGVYLNILPREITLEIINKRGEYRIVSGDIIDGDNLGVSSYKKDGFVYINLQNPNYKATVIPYDVSEDRNTVGIILLIIFAVILIAFSTYIVYTRRESLAAIMSGALARITKSRATATQKNAGGASCALELLATDGNYADGAISDTMAKSLIRRSREIIYTDGSIACVTSLNLISHAFSSGDRVDINSLKEKGLIPKNALWIKIEGEGVIDKALDVYANRFSLTAVKMIALTGGRATQARTRSIKRKKPKVC